MNDEISSAMRTLSHDRLHDLWLRAKEGEALEGEEATLARAMQEHSEYHDRWDHLDLSGGNELMVDGVNPTLHVSVHTVIENQLEQNTPPEVRKALDGLLKRGASRHDAIHAIAYEFNIELFPVLKHARPFDDKAYKRRLEKIARGK